ncbi:hypothetical protein HRbin12_00493 [bacterium HR12]|nr:hypothetical protein HRbin12_00493 [bacterium HR12]GIU98689.1 MAG: hypothetical protein KatS3mg014_0305 [Actinomycetota bacterium]
MNGEPVPPRPDVAGPAAPVRRGGVLVHGLDARPSATWRWWEALAVYLGAVLLGGAATLPVFSLVRSRPLAEIVASAVVALVTLGVVVLWLRTLHRDWVGIVGLPRPAGPHVRAGVAFALGLYPTATLVVGGVLALLFTAIAGEPVRPPEQIPTDVGGGGLVAAALYAVLVAPVGEELFFRGVLFRAVRDRHGFWPGAVLSSVCFGLVHYVPGPAAGTILLMTVMVFAGFGFAFIYERRGALWAPIAAHATFNVIGLALIFALR